MSDNIVINPPFPKNYASEFLVMDKGEGCWLYDTAGNKYLDFGSGISVNSLGYGREDLAEIASAQMKKLIHISNLYTTEPALKLAEIMTKGTPYVAVHFGNSGTEATEAALKYARVYALKKKGPGNIKVLSFHNGFHGRTLGALSYTPNAKYRDPFKPLLEGAVSIDLNDVAALKKTLDKSFAAVIVEPVQGEGGLDCVSTEFAEALNSLCAELDVILIADEVQSGMSRTGTFYGSAHSGLKPDIIALSKPLAAGLPLSATLIPEKVNNLIELGYHGTTFGGGPVTTSVALKVWELLSDPSFIQDVAAKGEYLKSLLEGLKSVYPFLGKVKGKGLLAGIEVNLGEDKFKTILPECRKKGLILLRSGVNVLRMAPPLVISKEELKQGVDILGQVLSGFSR